MIRYFYDYTIGSTTVRDSDGVIFEVESSAFDHAWTMVPLVAAKVTPALPWQFVEVVVRREDGKCVLRHGIMVSGNGPSACIAPHWQQIVE